jgi:hypothetical protein
MHTGIGWRAAIGTVVMMLMWPAAQVAAEEAAPAMTGGGVARPSVERRCA